MTATSRSTDQATNLDKRKPERNTYVPVSSHSRFE
jgi:hypothetical protein